MTNEDGQSFDRVTDSRREILKKGAAVTAGAGVLTASSGSAAAQEDDDIFGDDSDENLGELFNEEESMKALMFRQHFVPAGLFTIASPVIDYQPDVEAITDNVYSNYHTRTIRYVYPLNANVQFYPAKAAAIGPFEEQLGFVVDDDFVEADDFGGAEDENEEGEIVVGEGPIENADESELLRLRPTIFALRRESTVFGDSEDVVTVNFSPIPEENEEAIYNRFQDEINAGPFAAAVVSQSDGDTGNTTGTNNATSGN